MTIFEYTILKHTMEEIEKISRDFESYFWKGMSGLEDKRFKQFSEEVYNIVYNLCRKH